MAASSNVGKCSGCWNAASSLLTSVSGRHRIQGMKKQAEQTGDNAAAKAALRRELEKGLASGISKRTPTQIRSAFRKAREAA